MLTNQDDKQRVLRLNSVLEAAEDRGYAIGSFSPRYIPMIRPVLRAAERTNSAVIVQISQNELNWYQVELKDFAREFYTALEEENISVPVVLHLDHTREFEVIKEAIANGFTSVMIDASNHPFSENVARTKKVVEYAHAHGVAVEAELGRIGTTDFVETDKDEELFTDPEEAKEFVLKTNVDALAVSVGTAHGVYNKVRQPRIDYQRLRDIRSLTPVHLVLHGGSGVPTDMVINSIKLPDGGISKVNIATDLELAFLKAIGREGRILSEECANLPASILEKGQKAVEKEVIKKIKYFLGSGDSANDF